MNEELEREKLIKLKELYEKAVNSNQMQLLEPHLDEQFSFVTLTKKEFTDFPSFLNQWQKTRENLLKGGTYTVHLLPDKTRFENNIAIAKGQSENTLVTANGKKFEFIENWTVVAIKKGDDWKIMRIHSSIDPFKNPFLIQQVKTIVIKISVASLAFGILLGYFLSFLK